MLYEALQLHSKFLTFLRFQLFCFEFAQGHLPLPYSLNNWVLIPFLLFCAPANRLTSLSYIELPLYDSIRQLLLSRCRFERVLAGFEVRPLKLDALGGEQSLEVLQLIFGVAHASG